MAHKQPGLDGRHRDANGQISTKHGNTKVETIRQEHPNFAPGIRSDAKLSTVLKQTGAPSLTSLIKKK